MHTKLAAAAAVLIAALTALSGCGSSPAASTTTTEVRVFAAASMQPTFTELAKTFEAAHPGTTVTFNFAGSQALATQLVEGASADVFVSANDAQMKVITDAGLNANDPKVFVTNKLTIVVPPDNPTGIKGFSDLAKKGLKLVVCAPAVPCGAATEAVEKATGVTLNPVSEEQAVTGVLSKVRSGEADAGLVYRTDVIAAGDDVKGIAFPEADKAINRNPVVLLKNAPQTDLGRAWVDLLFSTEGQAVFTAAGFGPAE